MPGPGQVRHHDLGPISSALTGCVPATLGRRLGANLIDGLVSNLLMLPGALVLQSWAASLNGGILLAALVLWLGWVAFGLYQWHANATTGQTIGKRAANIRLVQLSGGAPGGEATGMRYIMYSVSSLLFSIGAIVGLVNMVSDPYTRRTWYDKSTDLVLVDLNDGRDPLPDAWDAPQHRSLFQARHDLPVDTVRVAQWVNLDSGAVDAPGSAGKAAADGE